MRPAPCQRGTVRKQHCAIRLDRPFHRLPQLRERQGHIPIIPGCAVGRISQQHIHAMFWQRTQALDAVHEKQALLRDTLSQSAAIGHCGPPLLWQVQAGRHFLFQLVSRLGHLLLDRGRPYRLGPCNKLFHRRMIRLHTSRIDPFLCGSVRNPNRSPVSRPAGRIRFRGSAEENPVFPSTTLKSSMTTPPKLTLAKPISFPCGSIGRTDTVIGTTASCKTASVRILLPHQC